MVAVAVILILFTSASAAAEVPELRFEASPGLEAVRSRFESIDRAGFEDIAQLVGVREAGPPIRVVLAAEDTDLARRTPEWIAGLADGEAGFVVLFPSRSPSYPSRTLEDVLRHEIAHVLISRVATGRTVPRWFHEGLAMAAERERRFRDQTRLFYELITGRGASFVEINELFSGGPRERTRAYALAGAFVHDLLQRDGRTAAAGILERVRLGEHFDDAYAAVTGSTLQEASASFWQRQRIWTTWAPILTSSTTLWLAITLLAILAIYARRQKNRAIEERWAEEDGPSDDPP
jgi:hypothetical protein